MQIILQLAIILYNITEFFYLTNNKLTNKIKANTKLSNNVN